MTISEFTLKPSEVEPVRRFEVFTGTGRRREWPAEEKARIVAESYEAGAARVTAGCIGFLIDFVRRETGKRSCG